MVDDHEDFTDEDLIASGLNPKPTCWSDSGISPIERAIMCRVAEQFPSGAYAKFVQMMNAGEQRYTHKRTEK